MTQIQSLKKFAKERLPLVFGMLSSTKSTINNLLVQLQIRSLSQRVIEFYGENSETEDVISFLKENGVHMVPYAFVNEYLSKEVLLNYDSVNRLRYINHLGARIYFPVHMTDSYIKEAVINAYIEQDKRSPHKYLPTDQFDIGGDVAILCGASDGIYTLEIVKSFNRVYLFEADPRWVEPLKLTLKDFLHKVEIVPLYVSSEDTKHNTTIDSFLKDKKVEVNYIQADIEGAELSMLKGASDLLRKTSNMKMSLCCYHTAGQEEELSVFLRDLGFEISTSKGYLLLWMQYPLKAPYLRRGVIYAKK